MPVALIVMYNIRGSLDYERKFNRTKKLTRVCGTFSGVKSRGLNSNFIFLKSLSNEMWLVMEERI